jgi:hypothetical protein
VENSALISTTQHMHFFSKRYMELQLRFLLSLHRLYRAVYLAVPDVTASGVDSAPDGRQDPLFAGEWQMLRIIGWVVHSLPTLHLA